MKGQAKALNGGESVPFEDLDKVFSGSAGKVLRVKVATTKSPKNGRDYTNCYIQEVIQTEAAEGLPEEPPQGNIPPEVGITTVGEGEVLA